MRYAVCISGIFSESILATFSTEDEAIGYIEFLKEQETIKDSAWAKVCEREKRKEEEIITRLHEAAEAARKESEELQEEENGHSPS